MNLINGIQQVGLGCENFNQTWQWYIDHLGIDIRILEDDTIAERMLPYTDGKAQKRHAGIAVSIQGGSGLEIWQYSERKPKPKDFKPMAGDLGIFAGKIRSVDIQKAHKQLSESYKNVGPLCKGPDGAPTFWFCDPWDNSFQVVQDDYVFVRTKRPSSGVCGACIGVTDMEKALKLYGDIIGYDKVVYDCQGEFEEFKFLGNAAGEKFRRVLIKPSEAPKGAFSKLYGPSSIELVQCLTRTPRKIYEGRLWGDPGFIQICFDVSDMRLLEKHLNENGYHFTVDSCPGGEIFDMGEASGHFTYIEDPDGTLIEFVQTHKVPLIKQLGLSINLDKRSPYEPLPDWMLRMLRFKRVKNVIKK